MRRTAAAGLFLVLLLLLTGALAWFYAPPPVYQVWLGDRQVVAGRNLNILAAVVADRAAAQLDTPVTLTGGGHEWTYSLGALGMTIPAGRVEAALKQAVLRVPWQQRFPWSRPALHVDGVTDWDPQVLDGALAPVRAALEQPSAAAAFHMEGRQPVITPEVNGVTVDGNALLDDLRTVDRPATLAVPTAPKAPAVTRASLEAMRIRKLIAAWTTEYDPTIPRGENVERAAKAFDGLMIKPGEILSYNATVGPVDAANGWKQAWVFVNGEVVPGIGGGVCQVASTFYGAALRANLEIMERHPHQLAVGYIAPSQDAAIAPGWEDLKIRNSTGGYIYVQTETGGGRVTFRLYGDTPDGQEVRIESKVLGTEHGLVSEAYRSVYMKGVLVKKEKLSHDSYLPAR